MTTPDPSSLLERMIAAERTVSPTADVRAANWAGLQSSLSAASATTGVGVRVLITKVVAAAAIGGGIVVAAVSLVEPEPEPAPAIAFAPVLKDMPASRPLAPAIPPPIPEETPAPTVSPDGWDSEFAHLQQIYAALRDDRAAAALALIDEHVRHWPTGEFLEETEAARVLATCAMARDGAARRTLAAFMRRWPDSLYGARVRRACDGDPS